MSYRFNIFTGTLDLVGGESPYWLPPVADRASLPSGDPDGACRVVLDEEIVFVYDQGSDTWHNSRLAPSEFSAVANSAGVTVDTDTTAGTPNITDYKIVLHAADASNPGGVSTVAQTFSGDKTFADDVIITGDLTVNGTQTILNTATLDVEDQNITINKNGNDVSAEGAGLTVERAGTDGSLVYEDTLVSKWKLGSLGSEVEVADVSSSQSVSNKTLDNTNNITVLDNNLTLQDNTDNSKQAQFELSSISAAATRIYTLPNGDTTLVGTALIQTLSNKTLDNTNDITVIDTDFTLQDNGDNTKQAQFNLSPISTATTRTFSLPDEDTVLVGTDTTQTLTNKTIDADNNTISNLTHGAEVDDPSSGVHGVAGNVVGTTDIQTLTNKTIDADVNTISNIDNDEIKALAGIDATKISSGSVSNTEFDYLDGVTSSIQTQLDGKVNGPVSATDNAIVRYDGVTGKLVQDSVVSIDDVGIISGVTQLNVDNLRIDGNTLSSTDINGDVVLSPDGTGEIDASNSIIKNVTDPTDNQHAATKKYVDDNTSFIVGDLDHASFSLAQTQTGANVTGLSFTNGVSRSARVQYSIVIDATSSLYESGLLEVTQRAADWVISRESTGDDTLVDFDIDATGQIIYDSPTYAGFVSGVMKFRATTTSI